MLQTAEPEIVLDVLDRGVRSLYRSVVEHVEKHDHSLYDRMRDMERAALALLEATGLLDEERIAHGRSRKIAEAAFKLRELLRHKPGAVHWNKLDPW